MDIMGTAVEGMKYMEKLMKMLIILLGSVVALALVVTPPASAQNKTDIAEVADELHPASHSEVNRELQPDRAKPPTGFYDGTLESIPGLNLPH